MHLPTQSSREPPRRSSAVSLSTATQDHLQGLRSNTRDSEASSPSIATQQLGIPCHSPALENWEFPRVCPPSGKEALAMPGQGPGHTVAGNERAHATPTAGTAGLSLLLDVPKAWPGLQEPRKSCLRHCISQRGHRTDLGALSGL